MKLYFDIYGSILRSELSYKIDIKIPLAYNSKIYKNIKTEFNCIHRFYYFGIAWFVLSQITNISLNFFRLIQTFFFFQKKKWLQCFFTKFSSRIILLREENN